MVVDPGAVLVPGFSFVRESARPASGCGGGPGGEGGKWGLAVEDVGAQAGVAEGESDPEHDPQGKGEDDRGGGGPGLNVDGDRAAEVAGQQDRAEGGDARDEVDGEAGEFQVADGEDGAGIEAERGGTFYDRREREDFADAVEGHEEDGEGADDATGPDLDRGDRGALGGCLHGRLHGFTLRVDARVSPGV